MRDTLGADPQTAVMELRAGQEQTITAEIASIEQALREHGCTV
jgi:hypothetical protein